MEWAVRTRTRHRTDGLNCFRPTACARILEPSQGDTIRKPKCATAFFCCDRWWLMLRLGF